MYDDALSALALVGLAGLFNLAVLEVVEPPTGSSVVMRTHRRRPPAAWRPVPRAAAMPVHELPRVVVRGMRSRDGDMVARDEGRGRAPPTQPGAADAPDGR